MLVGWMNNGWMFAAGLMLDGCGRDDEGWLDVLVG